MEQTASSWSRRLAAGEQVRPFGSAQFLAPLVLLTRDGAVTTVTWSNVLGVRPGGGAAASRLTLDVAGRSTPVQIAISEAPEALAFLDMLSSRVRVEQKQ